MKASRTIVLDTTDRKIMACDVIMDANENYVCVIKEKTRTTDQNAKMWPMLRDLSKQVEYHGYHLSEEEWKDFAVATRKQQKFVPNIDGSGFIVVGGHTSTMTKRAFSEILEVLYMLGAKFNVKWSEDARTTFSEQSWYEDKTVSF